MNTAIGDDAYYKDNASSRKKIADLLRTRAYDNQTYLAFRICKMDYVLGAALCVLQKFGAKYREYREYEIVTLLNSAVSREHVRCLIDRNGIAQAMVMWGWLTDETLSMAVDPNPASMPALSFNEGERLSVLMCCGASDHVAELIRSWVADIAFDEQLIYLHPGITGKTGFDPVHPRTLAEVISQMIATAEG